MNSKSSGDMNMLSRLLAAILFVPGFVLTAPGWIFLACARGVHNVRGALTH